MRPGLARYICDLTCGNQMHEGQPASQRYVSKDVCHKDMLAFQRCKARILIYNIISIAHILIKSRCDFTK